MNLRIALLAIAALGMTASSAVAGVILTAKGGERKGHEESTLYFEGNKMRVEGTGSDQESILIYDGDSQKMIAIEPTKKTFTEMTPENLKAATLGYRPADEGAGIHGPSRLDGDDATRSSGGAS